MKLAHPSLLRSSCVLLCGTFLSACQSEMDATPNVKFAAPNTILQVRAIDRSQLRPSVSLSNGAVVNMQRAGDNNWTGTINVRANTNYQVSVNWIETLPEGDLLLASWSDNIEVDADGAQIDLNSDSYDYSADADGDDITNLQERKDNTNPFVHNGQTDADNGGQNPANDSTSTNTNNADNNTDDGDNNQASAGNNTDAGDNGEQTDADATDNNDSNDTDNSDSTNNDDVTNNNNTEDNTETEDVSSTDSNVNLDKASVLVPRIAVAEAPTIDGQGVLLNSQDNLVGEWAKAVQFDDSGARLSISHLMIDNNSDAQDGAQLRRWAAMHDGVNLYVLVLSDDLGQRYADSDKAWQDDNLELFIDGDNSKRAEWGDDNDFHYLIPLLKQNSTDANHEYDGRFYPGPGSSEKALGLAFSTGPGIGPDGIRQARYEQDVYELLIPLASAGITIGLPFGFELQIDDDDDGGDRNSKWGWFHPSRQNDTDTDLTYLDPSVMGTLVLEE